MLHKLILSAALLSTVMAYAQENQTAPADTLLNVRTAGNISIFSTKSSTSITVKNIDGSPDNFYYQSGNQKPMYGKFTQTKINFPEITDVRVVETAKEVRVNFTNPEGEPLSYTFPFDDPDNRSVKSYIGSRGSDFGFNISRHNSTNWEIISQGLAFGLSTPIKTNAPMGGSMWRNMEVTWNMILGLKMSHRNHSVSMGLGLHTQDFTIKNGHYFHKNPDNTISLMPFEEGKTKGQSQLSFFSLQIPVLYGINFGHKEYCGFKIGPVVNFNTGAHITTKYESEGSDIKVKTGNIHQRKVTVDAMAMFNYRSIGVYARYAPMKRLNTSTGLEFGSFSTGIMFGF